MIGFVIFAFFVVAAQLVLVNYKPLEPVDYASAPARTTDVTQEPAAQR